MKEVWKGDFEGWIKSWRESSRVWSEEKNMKDWEMGKGGETEVAMKIK